MPDVKPGSASTVVSGVNSPEAPTKMSDLMLAMDVVDTLRHQEGIIAAELGQDDRDEVLKTRLRQIYEGQGLEVSDRILDEGIRGLKESRFVYTPPPPSFARSMAQLWIKRGGIGKIVLLVCALIAGVIGWQVWTAQSTRRATEQAHRDITSVLPARLSAAVNAAKGEARVPEAQQAVARLTADGQTALSAGDGKAVNEVIGRLDALRGRLLQEYVLRIVSRPGEQSGIFRIPDVNRGTRNYYVIVEALTPDGRALSLPITNEENGKVENVTKWGVRVPQRTYDAVRNDKLNDGIIQNNRLGEKKRGSLEPDYLMPVETGAITKW
jgi:hypothetical protein